MKLWMAHSRRGFAVVYAETLDLARGGIEGVRADLLQCVGEYVVDEADEDISNLPRAIEGWLQALAAQGRIG